MKRWQYRQILRRNFEESREIQFKETQFEIFSVFTEAIHFCLMLESRAYKKLQIEGFLNIHQNGISCIYYKNYSTSTSKNDDNI